MTAVTAGSAAVAAAAADTLADVDLVLVRARNASDAAAAVAWLDEHLEEIERALIDCSCGICQDEPSAADDAALHAISRGTNYRRPMIQVFDDVRSSCTGVDDTCRCLGESVRSREYFQSRRSPLPTSDHAPGAAYDVTLEIRPDLSRFRVRSADEVITDDLVASYRRTSVTFEAAPPRPETADELLARIRAADADDVLIEATPNYDDGTVAYRLSLDAGRSWQAATPQQSDAVLRRLRELVTEQTTAPPRRRSTYPSRDRLFDQLRSAYRVTPSPDWRIPPLPPEPEPQRFRAVDQSPAPEFRSTFDRLWNAIQNRDSVVRLRAELEAAIIRLRAVAGPELTEQHARRLRDAFAAIDEPDRAAAFRALLDYVAAGNRIDWTSIQPGDLYHRGTDLTPTFRASYEQHFETCPICRDVTGPLPTPPERT